MADGRRRASGLRPASPSGAVEGLSAAPADAAPRGRPVIAATRLFGQVLSLEARKAMSYRADFWINALLSFVAQLGVVAYLWWSIFQAAGSETIGGWSYRELLLYYVLVILVGKLVRGEEFGGGQASQDIYDGGLSRYLVYPTSYFRFKYAQHLGGLLPALVQLALFGALAPLLLAVPGGSAPSPLALLLGACSLVLGNLLYYTLQLPVQGVAFWADNVWSLSVLLRFASGLLGGAMLPLDLFPPWARSLLEGLPFRYLFDFPVNTLLGRIGPLEWLQGTAVALGWLALAALATRAVWRRGERVYTGVGI
jgi:ABC-2 type transport system permease protein